MKELARSSIFRALFAFAFLALALTGCQGIDGGELNLMEDNTAIFGGRDVTPEERIASLVVGLRFKDPSGNPQNCTGSWISSNWILTAAHCLPMDKSDLEVFRTVSLERPEDLKSLTVLQMVMHPQAKLEKQRLQDTKSWELGNRYDVALIQVQEGSAVNFSMHPLAISASSLSTEQKLQGAGFGFESYDVLEGATGKKLLRTVLLATDAAPREGVLYVNQKGDSGICLGDSGSPLFEPANEQSWENLVAVASSVRNPGSSAACGGESRFIMVEPHMKWIQSILQSSQKTRRKI